VSTETALQPAETLARSRRLAVWGAAGLGLGGTWFWLYSPWESGMLTALAIGIFWLGFIPMLRWLQRNDDSYPLIEVLQLTLVPFYAIPLITEHSAIADYPESVLERAAGLVICFQLGCSLGGFLRSRTYVAKPRRGWLTEEVFGPGALRLTAYTLTLNTAWLLVSGFQLVEIPREVFGTFRAIFFGIGTISLFIQARLWGAGRLDLIGRILLVANLGLQMAFTFRSLLLITGLILLLIALIGYFSTARRLPWVAIAVALPVVAILHNGKHQMRAEYWGEYARSTGLAELPDFYAEWFRHGLSADRGGSRTSLLLERASLLQIVCYVVETVPEQSPHLGGRTYWLIPPQVFPRFLWPQKPSPNDSVKMLSVHLGLLSAEQAEHTSIGYGLISEAVANFGLAGVAVLAVVLGWLLRWVSLGTAHTPTLSVPGIFRILCLAWCLSAETTLVVWLSSFYQACIAVFVPLMAWRLVANR